MINAYKALPGMSGNCYTVRFQDLQVATLTFFETGNQDLGGY